MTRRRLQRHLQALPRTATASWSCGPTIPRRPRPKRGRTHFVRKGALVPRIPVSRSTSRNCRPLVVRGKFFVDLVAPPASIETLALSYGYHVTRKLTEARGSPSGFTIKTARRQVLRHRPPQGPALNSRKPPGDCARFRENHAAHAPLDALSQKHRTSCQWRRLATPHSPIADVRSERE